MGETLLIWIVFLIEISVVFSLIQQNKNKYFTENISIKKYILLFILIFFLIGIGIRCIINFVGFFYMANSFDFSLLTETLKTIDLQEIAGANDLFREAYTFFGSAIKIETSVTKDFSSLLHDLIVMFKNIISGQSFEIRTELIPQILNQLISMYFHYSNLIISVPMKIINSFGLIGNVIGMVVSAVMYQILTKKIIEG